MSAFGGKADMRDVTASCLLLTQSGHRPRQSRVTALMEVPITPRLIVIADAAAEVAELGDEDGLGNRGQIGTWLGKHNSADFGDLAFRHLRHLLEDHLPEVKALGVLQRPVVLAEQRLEIRIGEGMQRAVAEIEAVRVEIAIAEAALDPGNHVKPLRLVGFDRGDRLQQHCFCFVGGAERALLGEGRRREREHSGGVAFQRAQRIDLDVRNLVASTEIPFRAASDDAGRAVCWPARNQASVRPQDETDTS